MDMTEKIDFKKSMATYQAKAGKFQVIAVPKLQYLMIDGHGDPNTSAEYAQALQALYPVAYKLKLASEKELGRDYVVPPLEGLSVQTLHIGSYDDEAGVLAQMHGEFIPQENLHMVGKHHEIYLSDPRKTAPEKLRTILRQPVQRVG